MLVTWFFLETLNSVTNPQICPFPTEVRCAEKNLKIVQNFTGLLTKVSKDCPQAIIRTLYLWQYHSWHFQCPEIGLVLSKQEQRYLGKEKGFITLLFYFPEWNQNLDNF